MRVRHFCDIFGDITGFFIKFLEKFRECRPQGGEIPNLESGNACFTIGFPNRIQKKQISKMSHQNEKSCQIHVYRFLYGIKVLKKLHEQFYL